MEVVENSTTEDGAIEWGCRLPESGASHAVSIDHVRSWPPECLEGYGQECTVPNDSQNYAQRMRRLSPSHVGELGGDDRRWLDEMAVDLKD